MGLGRFCDLVGSISSNLPILIFGMMLTASPYVASPSWTTYDTHVWFPLHAAPSFSASSSVSVCWQLYNLIKKNLGITYQFVKVLHANVIAMTMSLFIINTVKATGKWKLYIDNVEKKTITHIVSVFSGVPLILRRAYWLLNRLLTLACVKRVSYLLSIAASARANGEDTAGETWYPRIASIPYWYLWLITATTTEK